MLLGVRSDDPLPSRIPEFQKAIWRGRSSQPRSFRCLSLLHLHASSFIQSSCNHLCGRINPQRHRQLYFGCQSGGQDLLLTTPFSCAYSKESLDCRTMLRVLLSKLPKSSLDTAAPPWLSQTHLSYCRPLQHPCAVVALG